MMRKLSILILLPLLAGCSGLSIGSIAGTSTVSVSCGTGTTATYSAGLIPQMQPVNATCTGSDGKTQQAGISPGIDIATIAALVKQSMVAQGQILAPTHQ